MDQESQTHRRPRCATCEEIAKFLTPHGALCSDHALLASVTQISSDPWYPLPIHLNWKISGEVRAAIRGREHQPD